MYNQKTPHFCAPPPGHTWRPPPGRRGCHDESKNIIHALLLTQRTQDYIKKISEDARDDLNAGIYEDTSALTTFLG